MSQTYGKKESISVPYRGDIIVDACVLFGLRADIPKGSAGVDSGKFLNLLPFLAKNGYHIIIPEMVAYEVGEITASGIDMSDCFRRKTRAGDSILKPFLKDAALAENSPYKINPNIEIRANTGPAAVDEFCREFNKISENYRRRINEITSKDLKSRKNKSPNEIASGEARNAMDYLLKTKPEGDDAIISLVGRSYKAARDKPLFVMTDDADLREKIKLIPSVNVVSTANLIYGLVGAELSAEVGFPPDISAFALEGERRELMDKIIGREKQDYPVRCDEDNHISFINSLPFSKSLAELAEDLKKQKSGTADVNGCASADRLDKFRKKYGGNGDVGAGR